VLAYLKQDYLSGRDTCALGRTASAINALAVLAALEIVLHVPVSLQLTFGSFLKLTAIYLASAVPFFFTGLMFSIVFAREKRRVAALYGADLLGGAFACLAVVPLLNTVGGPNTVIVASVGMAVASVLWADSPRQRKRGAILAAAIALLIAANYSGGLIDVVYTKGNRYHADVEFARWNAISRVDVSNAGGVKWAAIDADVSPETLRVTALGSLRPGALVNLERPLRADARLGGHFVQGHVDATGTLEDVRQDGDSFWLTFSYPALLAPYIVRKGSIAVDGISLTVAGVDDLRFDVQIIPYTWEHTNLRSAKRGDVVNLECDILGKYVVRVAELAGISTRPRTDH
jgi:riboflavin synthase